MSLNQNDYIYIRACVVANGIPDQDGDKLNKEDIKRIFSNSIHLSCDVNHDFIPRAGIDILENSITDSDEKLGDITVPSGSWMVTIRTNNKDIIKLIQNGELRGTSLTGIPDRDLDVHSMDRVTYADIKKYDKLNPTFISIVEEGNNRIPFVVMDYNTYVTKGSQQLSYNDLVAVIKQFIPNEQRPEQADLTRTQVLSDRENGDNVDNETQKVEEKVVDDEQITKKDLRSFLDGIREMIGKPAQGTEEEKVEEVKKEATPTTDEDEKVDDVAVEKEAVVEEEKVEDVVPTTKKGGIDEAAIMSKMDALLEAMSKIVDEIGNNVEDVAVEKKAVKGKDSKGCAVEKESVDETVEKEEDDDVQPVTKSIKKGTSETIKPEIIGSENKPERRDFAYLTGRDPFTFRKL